MANTIITNARILDCTGADPFAGEIEIQGNRIKTVARDGNAITRTDHEVVDAGGATLMPGMVEAHAHPSFHNITSFEDIGDTPPEEHTLWTAHYAKVLFEQGFTSLFGAASARPRVEVAVRDFINNGIIAGPRMLVASPELTPTGNLGDCGRRHQHRSTFGLVCDGYDEYLKAARECARDGVDTLKINPSGDQLMPLGKATDTVMTEQEVAAVAHVAHSYGRRFAAHARSAGSVKLCVKYGVDVIYHATMIDEEAMDLLEAHKDEVFVAPTLGVTYAATYEAAEYGLTPEVVEAAGVKNELEIGARNMAELHKRGVRILPGGDYGLIWNPNGTDARDIEHFVKLIGMSSMDAILSATKLGGQIMGMGGELGQVKEGFLADLLLVDGDPLKDVAILQDKNKLLMIMKDGVMFKDPGATPHRQSQAA
ncbi:MAG: amidohydrolase family protein [Rhodospirillales bacterium]|nr:amidohydrolase family protein [Rhodospirillales bacterium]